METFKKISINGRLAYSIYCLKLFIKEKFIEFSDNQELLFILNEISEGLNEKYPENFEQKITELSPNSILDSHPDNNFKKYTFFKTSELESFKVLYNNLPQSVIEIIDSVIELALCNIYKNTGEYSECTFNELLYIFQILKREKFNLPIIPNVIMNSSFNQNNGWGNSIKLPAL
ncbi:hypothetical protein [Algibacter sp. 2305UL17-15]|uniref:hypothetical protein n=1 Tax=Algibacter sp. 2305UL17-15 TaxID=3231268 RepID=UPI00345AB943